MFQRILALFFIAKRPTALRKAEPLASSRLAEEESRLPI